MSACVSPPQLTSSYIVQTTASMAQAASMALPPRSNVRAPAIAPSGLPVMAIQCRPCNGGLCVAEYGSVVAAKLEEANAFMAGPQGYPVYSAPPRADDRPERMIARSTEDGGLNPTDSATLSAPMRATDFAMPRELPPGPARI